MNTFFGGKTKGNKRRIGGTQRLNKLSRTRGRRSFHKASHGLVIHLKHATNIPAADSEGYSDPYVKFKLNNRHVGRSSPQQRTLNPVWDEDFFTLVSDFQQTLKLEVWDWDGGSLSTYLGEVIVSLDEFFGSSLFPTTDETDFEKEVDFQSTLTNKKTQEDAGRIFFSIRKCRQMPKRKTKWTLKQSDPIAKQLIVDLVSGKDLLIMDRNGKSDPYCVLRFQKRKAKSRIVRFTTNPTFHQRFDFAFNKNRDAVDSDDGALTNIKEPWETEWAAQRILKIDVFDYNQLGKRAAMGTAEVDVAELDDQNGGANEVWARVRLNGQPAGFLLLYISVMDVLEDHQISVTQQKTHPAFLRVEIIQASKTKAKGHKKVCFVEAQVGKHKLRTQPVEDSQDPHFERTLEIPVTDIFASLELTLVEKRYDTWEEKPTLVGKLILPLFSFYLSKNHQPQWYILKEEDLKKASGAQIRFRAEFHYTFSPNTFIQLVKRHDSNPLDMRKPVSMTNMRRQIARVSFYWKELEAGIKAVFALLKWDYGFYPSVIAMIVWFNFCYFYKPWFVPLTAFCGLMYTRTHPKLYYGDPMVVNEFGDVIELQYHRDIDQAVEELEEEGDDEDEAPGIIGLPHTFSNYNNRELLQSTQNSRESKGSNNFKLKTKKSKTTLAERIAMPARILRLVQQTTGSIADYYERTVGIAIWRNPNLTAVISIGLLLLTGILMVVPLYILCIVLIEWQFVKRGLRKYGLAFRLPEHRVPFQPLMHLLQKVRTYEQCKQMALVKIEQELSEELQAKTLTQDITTRETHYVRS